MIGGSYRKETSVANLTDLVRVVPNNLNDWVKINEDTYYWVGDTQQLMYLQGDRYFVQFGSLLLLSKLKVVKEFV